VGRAHSAMLFVAVLPLMGRRHSRDYRRAYARALTSLLAALLINVLPLTGLCRAPPFSQVSYNRRMLGER